MSVFNSDRAGYTRMMAGAANWQRQDPHFQYLVDTASLMMYGGTAAALTPRDRYNLESIMATVQNSSGGFLGTPVADFVATNRAIISGGLSAGTMQLVNGAWKQGAGNSFGTGNLSIAATELAMQEWASGFRDSNNQLMTHRTYGVSSRSLNQWLPQLIKSRGGLNEDDVKLINIDPKARDSAGLGEFIKKLSEAGISDNSLEGLKKSQEVLAAIASKGLTGKNSSIIKKELKGEFSESEINQAIGLQEGKIQTFTGTTKTLKDSLEKMWDSIGENVKDLSTLFNTDKADEIIRYAKGIGMGDITKTSAAEIRRQMREIAVTAERTGRSPQEVAAERIQIASGMSAMYGGRVVDPGIVSIVQNASIGAQAAGSAGLYTREESAAAAVRSVANTQNMFQGAILADAVIREMQNAGGVSDTFIAKVRSMQKQLQGASLDELPALNGQLMEYLRSVAGDELVDSVIMRNKANAEYSNPYMSQHFDKLKKENIRTYLSNAGISGKKKAAMTWLGEKDLEYFGNRRDKSSEVQRYIAEGELQKAKDILIKEVGLDAAEADKYVSGMQKVGAKEYNTYLGTALLAADWIQQAGEGRLGAETAKTLAAAKILSGQSVYQGAQTDSDLMAILSGEISSGKMTAESYANYILKTKDTANGYGIGAISLGKMDAKTKSLVMTTEQKEALAKRLNVDVSKIDSIISDPALLEKMLDEKGLRIADTKVGEGKELYAYDRAEAQRKAGEVVSATESGFSQAVSSVFGANAVSVERTENGDFKAKYRISGSGDWRTKEEFEKYLKNPRNLRRLVDLASTGNKDAMGLLSGSIEAVAKGLTGEKFKSLKEKGKMATMGDLVGAVEDAYGVQNITALGSGDIDMLIDQGLVGLDADGKQVLTRDLTLNNKTFLKDSAVNAEAIAEAAKKDDNYKKLAPFFQNLALSSKPPSAEQIETVITKMDILADKLDVAKTVAAN